MKKKFGNNWNHLKTGHILDMILRNYCEIFNKKNIIIIIYIKESLPFRDTN